MAGKIMAKKKQEQYGNTSISMLKGEERVRKRPAVIFGSDDLEGCKHAVFEILSNAIDEAREGHGDTIIVTRYEDLSVEVEDFGRGCPVDWNEKEGRYNWELVFCELYAGGKDNTEQTENYEFSLGLNGLGACATQYASRYMDVTVLREGKEYTLHFEKGENEKTRDKRIRDLVNDNIRRAKDGEAQKIEIKILKNRSGSKGSASLFYYPKFSCFKDVPASVEESDKWIPISENLNIF